MDNRSRLAQFAPYRLKPDLNRLSANERSLLPRLVAAAHAMDESFWIQNYGDRTTLLAATPDPELRRLILMNYGPWDRLRGNEPFIASAGPKPPGANFYPVDMTPVEFETAARTNPQLMSAFTMVRRDENGKLTPIPYYQFFQPYINQAADMLRQASELAADPALKTYLAARAAALCADDYRASDYAWMDMKTSTIDILIGPMEIEDRLLGIKAAYGASILVKDWEETNRVSQYAALLPDFQASLPIPTIYKQELAGPESETTVYEVIHYAGNYMASPPLGIAWPADEEVQLRKGTRSMLLKNAIQARFTHNLLPLADLLIDREQRQQVTAGANFTVILLHELAHGLGVRHTVKEGKLVKAALKELFYQIEEAKAEVLGLFMLEQLHARGSVSGADLDAGYVTSLLRLLWNSDASHAILRLNYLKEQGAYHRDTHCGTYRVNMSAIQNAVNTLTGRLLRLQGDGDYEGTKALFERYGMPDADLVADSRRIEAADFPLGFTVVQDTDPGLD